MDALLALLMFTIVITLIHLFYINSPPLTQLHYLSKDTINILGNTTIGDMDSAKYSFVGSVPSQDRSNTVLEQLKVYSTTNPIEKARTEDQILQALFPPQYNYKIRFGGVDSPTDPKITVVSRRVISNVQVQ